MVEFRKSFSRFQELVKAKSGHEFSGFDEGLIAVWESYKPRLREHALTILKADAWVEADIGSGVILQNVIDSIEIQAKHGELTNNLVFWQNRFGHANRDHKSLLEALESKKNTTQFERVFFELYRGVKEESLIFEELSDLCQAKYPLLAYLFFLKDMDRFLPIQPTGFDRVFTEMGINFQTLSNCSWENYEEFNSILDGLRSQIESAANLSRVRLIDAHAFCWMFSSLLKQEANGELYEGNLSNERFLDSREKSIAEIKHSVNKTVFNSNGQIVERKTKEKELRMTDYELDKRIRDLLEIQGECCAITGLRFQFNGKCDDKNMLPSLDRIDSEGHYEVGNLQLVCRFINFWKQAADDAEFRRLINLVRGIGLDSD